MFGLFRSRAEKLALKLERLLVTQERAYEKGMWDVFVYAGRKVDPVLMQLSGSGWTEGQLDDFLTRRGLVKSISDPDYRDRMIDAQHRAGALY